MVSQDSSSWVFEKPPNSLGKSGEPKPSIGYLSIVCPDTDLYRKVFVFRKDPSDAHVVVKPEPEWLLQNFTMCLRSFTDLTQPYSLFSYATKAQDNEILLFPLPRKGLQKGYSISAKAVIILQQEQDSFEGRFDLYISFTGEMTDVYMWGYGLSPGKTESQRLCAVVKPMFGLYLFLSDFLSQFPGKTESQRLCAVVKPMFGLYLFLSDFLSQFPDLFRKVFVFPRASNDSYVILKLKPEQPLQSFTMCLRSYTDLPRPYALFSYATKAHDNEILLSKSSSGKYRLYVGGGRRNL
ncbi:Mucosal pentraxin [Chelonia mydas]|uniref:Mucosal pentraxin n=1 Tax=Chelonia mydas TaxID=8469 RepID=M7B3B7_CHEMY|nr:Mucosal pentraxin [Chelonia mydas]